VGNHRTLTDLLTGCCSPKSIMLEYHVTCKETSSKKKVVVEGKQDVVSAIQSKFDVKYDIVVQQPYEDDWLDVDNMGELNDGGKLQFIRKPATGMISELQFFIYLLLPIFWQLP